MTNILVVAAHQDDDILGCGATLAKEIENGNKVRIIYIAEGTSARYNLPHLTNEQKRLMDIDLQKRKSYTLASLKILGCKSYEFYNLPCGRIDCEPIIEVGKIIENEIKFYDPDIIFTHSDTDVNNDHRLIHQAVLQATRPGANNKVKKILCFEILSSTEWRFNKSFSPNVFIGIEEKYLKIKIASLMEYKSEVKKYPYPRSERGIITLAQYRGMQCANEYAEAFELLREIV